MTNKLDNLIREIIKARDNSCIICGNPNICVGHYMKRRNTATRWDLTNCNGICFECNREDLDNDTNYRNKLIDMYGIKVVEDLAFKARQNTKFSKSDLKEIEKELKRVLNEI